LAGQAVKPETELDVMVLFNEKLGLTEKQFESFFEVEETESELVLKQVGFINRKVWLPILDVVKAWGGKYAVQPRRFIIPIEKVTPKVVPIDEMLPKPTEKPRTKMPPESEGTMRLEDLKASESDIGQIFPVIKDQFGNILDGFHRKRVNPNWKETIIEVTDPLQALRIRIHANVLRRDLPWKEKHEWIQKARKILNPSHPEEVTVRELKEPLGMSIGWISKYDSEPCSRREHVDWKERFLGYNVWGFKDEKWRQYIAPAPSDMPDTEFYHGTTPPFVIHQLIKMFEPKTILDSMAGIGTAGYVCKQYDGIECDLFDIYPYPKFNVSKGDAESAGDGKKYDLVFNHIPYLQMVKYGDNTEDLSTMNETEFFAKMQRVFKHNYRLLNDNGIYAILVGDWRHEGEIKPLMAKLTQIGLEAEFKLIDEAITITSGHKGKTLQEYRATKHGYLAQAFDMLLIFRKK